MTVTVQGSVPYPPNADSRPIRQLASNLRQFSTGLKETSAKIKTATEQAQKAWGGSAAKAHAEHMEQRRRIIEGVAQSVGLLVPILETYAAAIDTTSAAYTTAVHAEFAARAGLPWTSGALAAAISAEFAASAALQSAGGVGAGAAAGPIAEIAVAQFLGVDRARYEAAKTVVNTVWEEVKDIVEDGKVTYDELKNAGRKIDEALESVRSTRPTHPTGGPVATPQSPNAPQSGTDEFDRIADELSRLGLAEVTGVADPVSPVMGDPFSRQVYGQEAKPIDLDLAFLADDSYPGTDNLPPNGEWVRATDQQLRAAGIDPARLDDRTSGFSAAVYFSRDGNRAVLAFAGTDEKLDWIANGGQVVGLSTEQYDQALQLGRAAKAQFGDKLVITGHSLGGGLASHAALATNTPAVTFNAAGLESNSIVRGGNVPSVARQAAANGLVRNYTVENEILTWYQEDNILTRAAAPDAAGTRIRLSEPSAMPPWISIRTDDRIERHLMPAVIASMQRDKPWEAGGVAASGQRVAVPSPTGR